MLPEKSSIFYSIESYIFFEDKKAKISISLQMKINILAFIAKFTHDENI